jgi:hypothetical protein
MNSFWLTFIITEAVGVAEAFVNASNLKPAVKAALEKFILAGTELLAAIQSGKKGATS